MFSGTKVRYGTYIYADLQYVTVFKQAKKVRLKYLIIMPLQTVFPNPFAACRPLLQSTHNRKAIKHSKGSLLVFA